MRSVRRRPLAVLAVSAAALLTAIVGAGFAFARAAAPTGATTAKAPNAGVVVVQTTLAYQDGAAAGTGMVLTSSGEVLTNNHVIEGATSIRVVVPQTGRSYKAAVVGYSVSADTAVLQLQGASGLATVSLGDSSKLRVGQAVRAVGNAGGTGTLTPARGTITGLGKSIVASDGQGQSEQLTGLIETDAALQPGDSGGPLFDGSGRVVGMNTAASTTGSFVFRGTTAGDSYAIPIGKALSIARQIEAGRSSTTVHVGGTAFLGIEVAPVTDAYGYGYGSSTQGVLVAGVFSGSPAARAGLGRGDEITALDGRAISSPSALVKLLLQKKPHDRVTLAWLDPYGARHTGSLTLASGPPQ